MSSGRGDGTIGNFPIGCQTRMSPHGGPDIVTHSACKGLVKPRDKPKVICATALSVVQIGGNRSLNSGLGERTRVEQGCSHAKGTGRITFL